MHHLVNNADDRRSPKRQRKKHIGLHLPDAKVDKVVMRIQGNIRRRLQDNIDFFKVLGEQVKAVCGMRIKQ
jgi:hypothetical protein